MHTHNRPTLILYFVMQNKFVDRETWEAGKSTDWLVKRLNGAGMNETFYNNFIIERQRQNSIFVVENCISRKMRCFTVLLQAGVEWYIRLSIVE